MFENTPRWARILYVYVAPFLLLMAPIIYSAGEYRNWKDAEAPGGQSGCGTRDGVLFWGAIVWIAGVFIQSATLMYTSWDVVHYKS